VSDITNAKGDRINEAYYTQERPDQKDHSQWRWSSQPLITTYQRNLWTKAIKRLLTDKHGKRKQRLGKWLRITHRRDPWYYSPSAKVFMERIAIVGQAIRYDVYKQRGATSETGFDTESDHSISAADATQWLYIPVDVTDRGNRLTAHHRSYILPATKIPATSIQEFISHQSTPRQRLLSDLTIIHDNAIFWIKHQWDNNGLLVSATDGSARADGTFGWVLTLPDGTALVEYSGPADGAPDQISSGQAESAGVLSLGTFLLVAAEYLETSPQGQCRNYIDSTAALQ
jgi:hypothetical protein